MRILIILFWVIWTAAPMAHADSTGDFFGSLGSECNRVEDREFSHGLPDEKIEYEPIPEYIDKRCSKTFISGKRSADLDEQYTLSVHDPIEVFNFNMQYKFLGSAHRAFYVQPPVLGEMRDRFVDNYPDSDSLLFTTSAIGLGHQVYASWIRLNMDVNWLYVYQRYSSNQVHSDEAIDPARNELFHIDQGGLSYRAGIEVDVFMLKFGASYRRLEIEGEEKVMADREENYWAKFKFFWWDSFEMGLAGQYYRRENNLRHDDEVSKYSMIRTGAYIAF